MKKILVVIVLLCVIALLEGQLCHAAGQLSSIGQLPGQRVLRITPAPHSPARNSGRAPLDPRALTLVPIRPDDRGSQPHGVISKAKMGYRIFDPPRDNAYVKGELCLKFYDLAREAVRITQTNRVVIENTHVASGSYYCRLATGEFEAKHKVILSR